MCLMKTRLTFATLMIFLPFFSFAYGQIYYSDKNITIYNNGKILYTGKNYGPSFSIAKDFTEWDESFFIAQDKYCVEDKVFDYTTD